MIKEIHLKKDSILVLTTGPLHSLIGRPSDFFNEGIAVAFQTDPYNGDYVPRHKGMPVHYWGKKYKDEGTLIPLDNPFYSVLHTYSLIHFCHVTDMR